MKTQTTWNLSQLINNKELDLEKEIAILQKESSKFIKKWKDRTDYLKDSKVLKEALDEYEAWNKNYGIGGKIGYYIGLKNSIDQNDTETKALLNKINKIEVEIYNNINFFELNIAKIDTKTQEKFVNSPDLKEYKHFLETLFATSKHLLSEKEEKILALKSKPSHSNWKMMISEFLSKEERKVLTESGKKELKNFTELSSLISSTNKKVRDSASIAYYDILEKLYEVATHEINSILENKETTDKLRGYKNSYDARLLSDDIEESIVNTLIETVSKHNSISKRYYKLKAQLFKVDKLKIYERNVPYGEITIEYPYKKAFSLVNNVFANLDPEFSKILNSFSENGLIDVYPKKGKRGGAFCAYDKSTTPTYMLLNHTDKLNDVLTLAHEAGHGINDELMKVSQNELHFGTPISTAEVASTFMEDFVLQELLEKADDETKLSLMMQKLNDDISTIFRQVACYKFELALHKSHKEKGYLSGKEIDKLFTKEMSSYMGKYLEMTPGSEKFWVAWSHIRSFFYVYSYASGLLISKALQNKVKKDKTFIKEVKVFLSAGESKAPKEIFKDLGLDITKESFWEAGIKEVDTLLKETEKLAKKLGKI